MFIDYVSHPKESLMTLLEKYSPDIYLILDDVLSSKRAFKIIYQDMLDILKWGFEYKEIRTRPIKFKIHADDEKMYELELRHFLANLMLWYSFIEMDNVEVLSEEHIFDFRMKSMGDIIDFIDNHILIYHDGDFYTRNKIVDSIAYHITAISNAFCLLIGMSISIYDIIKAERNNPEITEILYGSIDKTLQPVEIEAELTRRTKRLIELFCETDSDLRPLFLSGKNLTEGQFKEIAVKIGFKSDINGHTIPILIDANIMVTGINKPSYHYIEAQSGRKSLLLQKLSMSKPGAFSKKLNYNTTSVTLRQDYERCNSDRPITYHINDALFLQLLNGRYYYNNGDLCCIDGFKDTFLIGKDVSVLSPVTCSSEEGICRYCYGKLYDINNDLFSAGSYAATKISNPLGQLILSSKHYQGTSSDLITFNSDFDENFELLSNQVTLKDSIESDDELFIILDDVMVEETEDTEFYSVNSFKVVNETGEVMFNISEEHNSRMYLTDQLLDIYKRLKDKSKPISLDSFDDESSVLFTVEIKNEELSAPLNNIEKLLNSNDRMGAKTIDDVCQRMAEYLMKAGINYDLVHAEMLIRALVRKKSNEMEFPDFTRNGDHEDYQILRLNASLFRNPSPTVSLSTGYLRKQLLSPEFYKKDAPSYLDALFVDKLSDVIKQ